MRPRVAPSRGRAVAVDELGRRRRNKSDAGVVEVTCANSLRYKAAPKYGDTDYPDGGYLARVALAVDGTTCWPKVADGGWKRYEQAHRRQLVSMFVPKLRLPADVLSLVVDFWAHIGYY